MSEKLGFWNSRGKLGKNPGSNDFLLKQLEIEKILEVVAEGSTVLDVGCGDGETLVTLATKKRCTGVGVDFSDAMIEAAQHRAKEAGAQGVQFRSAKLPDLPADLGSFDYVMSERSLINLASTEEQHRAFQAIMGHVKPGGHYLMVESFAQGLARSNALRKQLGLEAIDAPWHNFFVDETAAETWQTPEYELVDRQSFTSTYHFLSRVVYAKLAADSGEELRYDSPINLMAMKLPPMGDCGPVRLWMWRRSTRQS